MGLFNSAFAPLALLVGYLLGSIPFGLLLTRAAGKGDLRSTLVAPMLPEPMLRTSPLPAARVNSSPKGIEPNR